MRLLNLHNRKGREGRRQQCSATVVEFCHNEIEKKNGSQIGQRGELATQQFQRAVVSLPKYLRCVTNDQ